MESVMIPRKVKRPNLNAAYGLSYRSIPVKRDDIEKLKALKETTGQPITTLVGMAINHFLRTAKPAN